MSENEQGWTDITHELAEREQAKLGPANMEQPEQTIEIDCAPGNPRPGDLYPGVIEGTGLPERSPRGTFFGNWTWDYNDIPPDEWERIKPTLKERISKLYDAGLIRYGSW